MWEKDKKKRKAQNKKRWCGLPTPTKLRERVMRRSIQRDKEANEPRDTIPRQFSRYFRKYKTYQASKPGFRIPGT